MNDNFCELILSCTSWQKAQQVVDVLLEKHLVVKTEVLPAPPSPKIHVLVKANIKDIAKLKLETDQSPDTVLVSSVSLVQ